MVRPTVSPLTISRVFKITLIIALLQRRIQQSAGQLTASVVSRADFISGWVIRLQELFRKAILRFSRLCRQSSARWPICSLFFHDRAKTAIETLFGSGGDRTGR